MRVQRQSGYTKLEVFIIIFVVTIIMVGQVLSQKAKKEAERASIQRAEDINKNWQEKNCDYFKNLAVDAALRKDAEKMVLYLKLTHACIDLRKPQPKTPE